MIITIDGPSASGKSTAAQALAKELNFYYLNTGLLYRALAYLLITHEKYAVEHLTHPRHEDIFRYIDPARLSYHYDEKAGNAKITFDGEDITADLKGAHNDQAASIVSVNEAVREALLHFQRRIAQTHDIVIEGRDSGSVVFPEADYKFFLTASLQERARRWQILQEKRGVNCSIEQAAIALQERDTRDQNRAVAPLCIPDDAKVIDSTGCDVTQVIEAMMKHIR